MEPIELSDELASIRRINTYTTPPDYFTNLADEIISKLYMPVSSKLPFSEPPADYFANLADDILLKIKEEAVAQTEVERELHQIEPLLTGIPKINVYSVPQGYFDNFSVSIPVKKPARIVRMRRSSRWFTSAAAAVVTGVIAVSIIFTAKDNRIDVLNTGSYSKGLSKVPDTEISDYLITTSQEPDAVNNVLEDINGSEKSNFKSLLNHVSDNELHDYLIENDDVR